MLNRWLWTRAKYELKFKNNRYLVYADCSIQKSQPPFLLSRNQDDDDDDDE